MEKWESFDDKERGEKKKDERKYKCKRITA